jgi:hypothetical protein
MRENFNGRGVAGCWRWYLIRVMRGSPVLFVFRSGFARRVGEVEKGRREGLLVWALRERDWKRWRRGETIRRIELCVDAMVEVCDRLWVLMVWSRNR